jgi:hypothetical protein
MTDLLRNFDQLVIDQLNESYTKNKDIDEIKGSNVCFKTESKKRVFIFYYS